MKKLMVSLLTVALLTVALLTGLVSTGLFSVAASAEASYCAGAFLTLENGITLACKVKKSALENLYDPYVTFTQGSTDNSVTEYTESGNYYLFTYNSQETSNVKATLHATRGDSTRYTSDTVTYHVAYCAKNFDGVNKMTYEIFNGNLPYGDANGDSAVDLKDLVRLKKITAGITGETAGSDVSGDGSVAANDLVCLQKLLVCGNLGIRTYTVTFQDYNGNIIEKKTVLTGFTPIAPSDPIRSGYKFAGWSGSFANVTQDITVTATYNKVESSGLVGETPSDWEYD